MPQDYDSCLLATVVIMTVFGLTLTTLPGISIDRFWAICYPVHYRNHNKRAVNVAIIGFSWIFGILLGSMTWIERYPEENYGGSCTFSNIITTRATFIVSSVTSITCLLMVFIYFFIFRKIRQMVSLQYKNIITSKVHLKVHSTG